MSNPELDALTARVARLELDAGLGASRDRDLSDLTQLVRAMDHMVRATALTVMEHNEQFRRVQETQGAQTALLNHIINLLTEE